MRPFAVQHLVPCFIIGFMVMAALRSAGLIPAALLTPIATVAHVLTIVSMAALGLSVDIRSVAKAGLCITAAVVLSILVLMTISLGLIRLLAVP